MKLMPFRSLVPLTLFVVLAAACSSPPPPDTTTEREAPVVAGDASARGVALPPLQSSPPSPGPKPTVGVAVAGDSGAAPAACSLKEPSGDASCDACLVDKCCEALRACDSAPDCAGLEACFAQCDASQANDACYYTCGMQHPVGTQLVTAADICAERCVSVCGNGGGGDAG